MGIFKILFKINDINGRIGPENQKVVVWGASREMVVVWGANIYFSQTCLFKLSSLIYFEENF
jgi:hypothetical protein